MAGKATSTPPAGDATATDLTATLARLDALASDQAKIMERLSDVERILKDGETLEELRELVAKAAPLSDFETLTETVAKHGEAIAAETARLMDGELIPGELVEGPDLRGDLLKAFRQIEAIANHINVRLPA